MRITNMRITNSLCLAILAFGSIIFYAVPGDAVGAGPSAVSAIVTIDNFAFTPQLLTVKVGTTITWTNHDDIPHAVMSENADFHSKALDTDDSFSYTAAKPGTYSYFCSLHPKMTAKVVVEE